MVPTFGRLILLGLLAGFLGTLGTLLIAYLVGVVVTLFYTGELFATLLVAGTVLPIMLITVLLPLSFLIGWITGLVLAIISSQRERRQGTLTGAIVGIVLAELLLSVVAPWVFDAQPGDFVSIIRSPALSGCYGLILGSLTGLIFRRVTA